MIVFSVILVARSFSSLNDHSVLRSCQLFNLCWDVFCISVSFSWGI